MNSGLVTEVIKLVGAKYGRPTSHKGNHTLGPVTAKWEMRQGMQIEVFRGWPDTTTYLRFVDKAAYDQLQAEYDAQQKAQVAQKAKAQSAAF